MTDAQFDKLMTHANVSLLHRLIKLSRTKTQNDLTFISRICISFIIYLVIKRSFMEKVCPSFTNK